MNEQKTTQQETIGTEQEPFFYPDESDSEQVLPVLFPEQPERHFNWFDPASHANPEWGYATMAYPESKGGSCTLPCPECGECEMMDIFYDGDIQDLQCLCGYSSHAYEYTSIVEVASGCGVKRVLAVGENDTSLIVFFNEHSIWEIMLRFKIESNKSGFPLKAVMPLDTDHTFTDRAAAAANLSRAKMLWGKEPVGIYSLCKKINVQEAEEMADYIASVFGEAPDDYNEEIEKAFEAMRTI
ncbi:MAG: hypothetical protein CMK03_12945 [Ponticaulis sp.]|nr:hypothetical protein [Ponticaulis sp.]